MQKKTRRKLRLQAETLRSMTDAGALKDAVGGTLWTGVFTCGGALASCYSCYYTGCQTVCWRCPVI